MKKVLSLAILSLMFFVGARSYAETPPANAEIGNQATLEYVSGTGESRTVLSNIVITTVNPVYGLNLTPDNSLTGVVGQEVYFFHTLTNLGNTEDTFDMTVESIDPTLDMPYQIVIPSSSSDFTPISEITLEAGESQTVILVAGSTSSAGAIGSAVVQAKSVGDFTKIAQVTDTLEIVIGPVIAGYKIYDINEGDAGDEILVTFSFLNRGGDDGTNFELTDTLDDRFEYVGDAEVEINNDGNFLPISSGGGTVLDSILTVNGQDISLTRAIGVPQMTETGDITAAKLKLRFKIKTKEDLNAMVIPNIGNYNYSNLAGSDTTYKQTNEALFEIVQHANLTFVGETLEEVEQGALIKFTNVITNTGNDRDTFDIQLINNEFPSGSTFFLSFDQEDNEDFNSRVPLFDTTGSGIVDTGVMEIGETKNILLWVQLPNEAVGSNLKITKHGESHYDKNLEEPEGAIALALDQVTTIRPADVDLTNNYSLEEKPNNAPGIGAGPEVSPVTQIKVTPGNTGYFSIYVNNTSSYLTDEYVLDVSTDPNFEELVTPEGVNVRFETSGGAEIKSTGPILPQENLNVRAVVDVETTALAGNISLYFRARSLTTGALDIKHDMVIIGILRNVSILPNNTGEVYAGSSIVYTHTVTNGGNVTEGTVETSGIVVKLTDERAAFSSVAWYDADENGILDKGLDKQLADFSTIGGLEPGESIKVFIEVSADLTAKEGISNDTKFRLDISKGIYNVYHPDVYAEDTTTIILDSITIKKFQGTSENVGFDPSNTANMTQDPQSASPEDYIYYRILIENTGITTIENVVVEDLIPQYTTMAYGQQQTTPTTDSKPVWRVGTGAFAYAQTIPAEGTKGIVKADIGSLEPGQQAELYFNVKVDGTKTVVNP